MISEIRGIAYSSWITVTNHTPSYEGGASSLWGYLTLSTLPAGLIVTKLAENICDGLCNHVPNCQDCWESGLLKKQPKSPQLLGVWVSGYGSWPRPMAFLIPLHSAPQPMGDQQHFLPNKTITPCSQVKKKKHFPLNSEMSFKQFVREMSFTTVFPTLSSSPFDHHSLQPSPVHLPCDCTITYIGFRQSSLNTKRQKYPVRVNQWWLSTPSPSFRLCPTYPSTPAVCQSARVPEH